MGVINLSPESANTFTVASGVSEAVGMAQKYREWGAQIIDVGGQSSRYDTATLSPSAEIERVIPVIEALVAEDHTVSIDTWKPEVAEAAVAAGVQLVNDTGGLRHPEMRQLLAGSGVKAIMVYVEADNPHAVDVVDTAPDKIDRITDWFRQQLSGIDPLETEQLILDPGIAINYRGDYQSYTRSQLEVIRQLAKLAELGLPVLVPIPRKQSTPWVHAFITLAIEYGADLIRCHDVEAAGQIVQLLHPDRNPGTGKVDSFLHSVKRLG